MSEDGFTNRRGHDVSSVQAALDSLPEPAPKIAPVAPKPVRRKRRKLRVNKRVVGGFVVVLAIAALSPVLIGEYVRFSYANDVTTAKKSVSELLSSIKQQQKSGATSQLLLTSNNKLAVIADKLCAGGLFDNIAKLYPRSTAAYADCNAYREKLANLDLYLKEAGAQMLYLEQLKPLLGGVTKPLEEQFAVFTSQQENWQTFVSSFQQLSAPATFQGAHASLLVQAQSIRDLWIALVQASDVYDSAKYSEARGKLTAAYAAFREQTAEYTSAISANQLSISSAVAALQ